MILLDTHIWVWWVSRPDRLESRHRDILDRGADRVFGISVISCWEVAKLVEYGRLKLDRAVGLWIEGALAEPGISLLHLHPRIVVESTQLPQPFHRDPADQLLVATARIFRCPIMTEDSKIAAYPHVQLA
ncbi:MAG TPA: type II toxin-antitoxin system VapC family toxin [Bryobacteraceae bacterium]|nr:type II toxin-antitoxin system VapC family toxin [Bryobacteraceae bacterium]